MTPIWGVLAAVGAVAFVVGARSADAPAAWSIYLVNLVFWSGLAVTGQMAVGIVLDHFGALGLERHPISPGRVAGIALLIIGVFLLKRF